MHLIFGGKKTWGAAFSDFIREPNSCEGSQGPLPTTQTVTDFLKIFWQWGFQNSWERIFRGQEENLSDFLTENSLYFWTETFQKTRFGDGAQSMKKSLGISAMYLAWYLEFLETEGDPFGQETLWPLSLLLSLDMEREKILATCITTCLGILTIIAGFDHLAQS